MSCEAVAIFMDAFLSYWNASGNRKNKNRLIPIVPPSFRADFLCPTRNEAVIKGKNGYGPGSRSDTLDAGKNPRAFRHETDGEDVDCTALDSWTLS
jgi:hypothetical protein